MTHDAAVLKAREIASRVLAPSAGKTIRRDDSLPRQSRRLATPDCLG